MQKTYCNTFNHLLHFLSRGTYSGKLEITAQFGFKNSNLLGQLDYQTLRNTAEKDKDIK